MHYRRLQTRRLPEWRSAPGLGEKDVERETAIHSVREGLEQRQGWRRGLHRILFHSQLVNNATTLEGETLSKLPFRDRVGR
jgi:hypothetical protein